MKKILVLVYIFSAVLIFAACAQKQAAQGPEQPGAQTGGKQKAGAAAKDLSSEAITDRDLAKAGQASNSKYSFKEIQTKIQDIHFDFDKYDIRDDAKPILKDVAAALSKETKAKLVIEGHCDEKGTVEYNLALGDRRANSTKSHLGSLGIPSKRIDTVSYGKEKPLCTESTEDCRQKNRRSHFVLIEETGK